MSATVLQIDFNSEPERHMLYKKLRQLRGVYRVEVCRWRPRRSDRQNRRYWPAMVVPFAEFLREQGQVVTELEAHELIKHKLLRKTWQDPKTGERHDYTQSSTDLNLEEFTAFTQAVECWLSDFGIVVDEVETA